MIRQFVACAAAGALALVIIAAVAELVKDLMRWGLSPLPGEPPPLPVGVCMAELAVYWDGSAWLHSAGGFGDVCNHGPENIEVDVDAWLAEVLGDELTAAGQMSSG